MRITNPKTKEEIETDCTGCPCHWNPAIQMGDRLNHGCCLECGCPKTEEGWAYWVQEKGAVPRPITEGV